MCEFSGFRSSEVEKSVILEYCAPPLAAGCPTFRGYLVALSSRANGLLDHQRLKKHWATNTQWWSGISQKNSVLQTKIIGRISVLSVISGFRRDVDEICALMDITQRRMVILYRRFGTTYRSHLQGSKSPRRFLDPWRWDGYIVPKRP
jgi:hypothetical protein